MSSTLWLIIACGILSIVYAIWATKSVLAADAGNSRMQEIAGSIREGAMAYLSRQYTTIAIVGACCVRHGLVVAWRTDGNRLSDWRGAFRCCRLYRHARLRTCQRPYCTGCFQEPGSTVWTLRSSPVPSRACWLPVSLFWAWLCISRS